MKPGLFLVILMILFVSTHLISFSNAQVAQATMPYEPNPKVVVDGTIEANEYKGSYNETTTGITIYWENNGINMYVALESPGTGWVGIGFGPTGTGMNGANIIIGYVDDGSGSLVLSDEFGQGWTHSPDVSLGGSDNIVSKAGSQSAGKTIIEFVFPLNTGDSKDYSMTPGGTYGFFVAYEQSKDDLTSPHTNPHSDTLDFYLEAPGTPPKADFTYVLQGFMLNSTDNSSTQVGSILSWFWNFGDGTNSTKQNSTHTFSAMGEYAVELKVTDSRGNVATKSQNILVPSKGERLEIWSTQVALVSVMIVLLSFFAVGITVSERKEKEGTKKWQ